MLCVCFLYVDCCFAVLFDQRCLMFADYCLMAAVCRCDVRCVLFVALSLLRVDCCWMCVCLLVFVCCFIVCVCLDCVLCVVC